MQTSSRAAAHFPFLLREEQQFELSYGYPYRERGSQKATKELAQAGGKQAAITEPVSKKSSLLTWIPDLGSPGRARGAAGRQSKALQSPQREGFDTLLFRNTVLLSLLWRQVARQKRWKEKRKQISKLDPEKQ